MIWIDRLFYLAARRPLKDAEIYRRGFKITVPEHRQKLEAIGQTFLGGYNLSLLYRDPAVLRTRLIEYPRSLRPFAFEGAAMGFGLRASLRLGYHHEDFETFTNHLGPEYLYLHYVGLGWWLQIRYGLSLPRLWKCIEHLDPRYRPLCLDGYGFKLGFFHYLNCPGILQKALAQSQELAPFIVHGFGRSLRFLYRDDWQGMLNAIEGLGPQWEDDAWQGWGLAAAFTEIDNPASSINSLLQVPPGERAHVLLGMTFAWTAWERCDRELLATQLQSLSYTYKTAIEWSIQECHEALKQAEQENPDAPYLLWRRCTREAVVPLWQTAGVLDR
jgi:hypothetical protein